MKHFQEHQHHQDPSHHDQQPDHESRRFRFQGRCGDHRGFRRGHHMGEHFAHFGGRNWGFAARVGRGAGRIFEGGDLKVVLLQLIAEKPRHGYELMKAIEEKLNGAYSPSPGLVYPTLTMLEEMGYTTVTTTDNKKLYTITDEGKKYLEENKDAVNALFERMNEMGSAFGPGRSPQIIRAVQNCMYALRLKTSSASVTPEQIQKIVDAIDTAAKSIEQA
jgi:DNA-binding PadR family transcriptional regulator